MFDTVHIVFDLKFKNGRKANGRKRRFRNLVKALNLLLKSGTVK